MKRYFIKFSRTLIICALLWIIYLAYSILIAIEICKSHIKKLLEFSTSTILLATKTYCLQYIWSFGEKDYAKKSDCVIVLGAAVYGDKPSPVFEERIKHAINIFQKNLATYVIFTGGYGKGVKKSESQTAKDYSLKQGISRDVIFIEEKSKTTYQNLIEAKKIMDEKSLKTAIIVSDPLHLKRAIRMADGIGITAVSSPTPTSLYKSFKTKFPFLMRELYFYHHYTFLGQ